MGDGGSSGSGPRAGSWTVVLAHRPSLDGRQVEQFLPAFTQEQFLQRPLLLHEQQMVIL